MNERTKVALIGGLVAGVLSGLPIISGCCFLWALLGGFLALFLYTKNQPGPLQMGDAVKIGATAGVIAAVISIVLGIPFMLLQVGGAAMSETQNAPVGAGIMAVGGVFGLLLRAGLVVGFAILGGVIGNAVVGKKGGPTPPPPPQNYGGTGGAGGYGGTGGTTGTGSTGSGSYGAGGV